MAQACRGLRRAVRRCTCGWAALQTNKHTNKHTNKQTNGNNMHSCDARRRSHAKDTSAVAHTLCLCVCLRPGVAHRRRRATARRCSSTVSSPCARGSRSRRRTCPLDGVRVCLCVCVCVCVCACLYLCVRACVRAREASGRTHRARAARPFGIAESSSPAAAINAQCACVQACVCRRASACVRILCVCVCVCGRHLVLAHASPLRHGMPGLARRHVELRQTRQQQWLPLRGRSVAARVSACVRESAARRPRRLASRHACARHRRGAVRCLCVCVSESE